MGANVALTANELTALNAGNDSAPYWLSYKADTSIATANVQYNAFSDLITQIPVVNMSAGWNNIRAGMCARITSADGVTLRGYYRVRKGGYPSVLMVEQVAPSDPGSIANANRAATFTAGDLVTILERYDLYSMKPFTAGATIFQDYDTPVGTYNTGPELVVNVAINGRPGDYVTQIASDGGTEAITAVITIARWPTSTGSTVTYAWTTPTGWTNVTGATGATFTADAPPGDYTLYCTVTDSVGGATEICRWVRIHSPGDPPLAVNITADSEDWQGRKMTIRAVQAVISAIPPGARCCLTGPFAWNGGDVATANHQFIGFLQQQPYQESPGSYESTADILGTGYVLDKLMGAALSLTYTGFVGSWEQVVVTLSTIQFAIWWTLRWRCANFLKCFNFDSFTYGSATGRRRNIPVPQGSIFRQLKTLGDMIDANVGSRPDGGLIVQPLPSMLQTRTGVATRATLTDSIFSDVTVSWRRRAEYGDVFHTGVYISDAALTADMPVQAEAPGLQSFGQADKSDKQTNRLYEDIEDAKRKVGYWAAWLNNEFPDVSLTIKHNWDVFVMADLNRVVVSIPAGKSPTGSAITLTCTPLSMQKKWIPGGRAAITLKLAAETTGVAGQYVGLPIQMPMAPTTLNPITSDFASPSLPSMPDVGGSAWFEQPAVVAGTAGEIATMPTNGNGMVINSSGSVWLAKNVVTLHAPTWNNITPGTGGTAGTVSAYPPVQVLFDPMNGNKGTASGLYLLTNDTGGSVTQVQYTAQAAVKVPAWTPGTLVSGVYPVMRAPKTAGALLLYSPYSLGTGVVATSYTVSFDTGGYANYTLNQAYGTTVLAAGGNPGTAAYCLGDTSGVSIFVDVTVNLPTSVSVTNIRADVQKLQPAYLPTTFDVFYLDSSGGTVDEYHNTPSIGTAWVNTGALKTVDGVKAINIRAGNTNLGGSEEIYMDNIVISADLAARDVPAVVFSSDYGATFGSALPIGTVPFYEVDTAGFDISPSGGCSFAAGSASVWKATAPGSAYSLYASFAAGVPNAILAPWYRYNSTTVSQMASGTPDILVGMSSGTIGLCWLLGGTSAPSGTVNVTPEPGWTCLGPHALTISYGKYIAAEGQVGGTPGLWESDNAGDTWMKISGFTPGSAVRVRRNDTTAPGGRGVVFALNSAGSVCYSSHLATYGQLYDRVTPGSAISFDTYP